MELVRPSSDRRKERPCAFQGHEPGKCGGCPWMIGTYESQLRVKFERVLFQLKKAKLVEEGGEAKVCPIVASPEELGFRNRAQVKANGIKLGFVGERSHDLIEISDCKILNEKTAEQLQFLRSKLPNPEWTPVPGKPWVFFDLSDEVDVLKLQPNRRLPFRQGNTSQNLFLKKWLAERFSQIESSRCVELFCGSGNFTEVIAHANNKIIAVEVVEEALVSLRSLNLPKVEAWRFDLFQVAEVKKLAARLNREFEGGVDCLVLDPPREGFSSLPGFVESLDTIQNILYVSCDLSTFIRDTAPLMKMGFELLELCPVDMFPQTPHVEVLGHFQKG